MGRRRVVVVVFVLTLAGYQAGAVAGGGCKRDSDCKRGRSCVKDSDTGKRQCKRVDRCESDVDCPGDLVCEQAECVAESQDPEPVVTEATSATVAESAPIVEPPPERSPVPSNWPQRAVDQPVSLPSGRFYAQEQLQLIADSSSMEEITFGEWLHSDSRFVAAFGPWEVYGYLGLKVFYPYDAPTLWTAAVEVDRRIAERLKVGAQLYTSLPTESYYTAGLFAGALWQSRPGKPNLFKVRGGMSFTDVGDADNLFGLSAGAVWYRQLSDPVALKLELGSDLFLETDDGDPEPVPYGVLGMEWWTQGLWMIEPAFYASPDQGSLRLAVGRVF